jgi:hypothetical protein
LKEGVVVGVVGRSVAALNAVHVLPPRVRPARAGWIISVHCVRAGGLFSEGQREREREREREKRAGETPALTVRPVGRPHPIDLIGRRILVVVVEAGAALGRRLGRVVAGARRVIPC